MPGFVPQQSDKVRKQALGPVTLNQLHANIEFVDGLALREHFLDGQHNALEVPWVLGKVDSGTNGYLFDADYAGAIARPGTGRATIGIGASVVGEVVTPDGSTVPAASVICNPSGTDIHTYPQVCEWELTALTTLEVRLWRMTSTLGSAGNSWGLHVEGFDVGLHAQKQPVEASELLSYTLKQRRDFLTHGAADWNSLVQNQAEVRKMLSVEHASTGAHLADRVAKASGWFRPIAGPSYEILVSHGVASVSLISTGVVEVTLDGLTLSSTNLGACFPQAQPATQDEFVLVCGRVHSTTKFRFYIYTYSVAENKWDRGNRPFFAAMFGRPA